MSEEKNQNEIEEVTNEDEHKDVEHYCYLCRRPESAAGKMLELPNNIFICTDCMQRTLNSMGNGQFGFIDARNMDLDSMDITKMMNDMQSMQPKAEVKKKKKDKKDTQIEDLTDKLRRQMAEFDNFRKRTEKEKSQMYEVGAKDIIEKILPVVDNFERGLDAVKEEDKEDPFVQGMEKVYKHLLTTLEGIEVKPIEAVGQPFDPNFHNAVMHVEDENFGENIVAEEFQKGYTYRDSVVRHSMVKVAN